jgi:hypothetical protein
MSERYCDVQMKGGDAARSLGLRAGRLLRTLTDPDRLDVHELVDAE